jgi:pyruvate/2-oxoglutarate dehydrogenase complex dihydrolipoamide acyltransferase (E2) component
MHMKHIGVSSKEEQNVFGNICLIRGGAAGAEEREEERAAAAAAKAAKKEAKEMAAAAAAAAAKQVRESPRERHALHRLAPAGVCICRYADCTIRADPARKHHARECRGGGLG